MDIRPLAAASAANGTVFSNPGMSLEQPEIDDAKRVDLL
jgi:hypothetical protein